MRGCSAPPGHEATMYARTRCRCARSPSGHGQRYPAAYLLRGAGYKISPPPLGGQGGYEIALYFSRLRSPFGVEFVSLHLYGSVIQLSVYLYSIIQALDNKAPI